MKYRISIDRACKSWAIFTESFEIVRPFTKYSDEESALLEAKLWVAENSNEAPEIVYPKITSFKTSRR